MIKARWEKSERGWREQNERNWNARTQPIQEIMTLCDIIQFPGLSFNTSQRERCLDKLNCSALSHRLIRDANYYDECTPLAISSLIEETKCHSTTTRELVKVAAAEGSWMARRKTAIKVTRRRTRREDDKKTMMLAIWCDHSGAIKYAEGNWSWSHDFHVVQQIYGPRCVVKIWLRCRHSLVFCRFIILYLIPPITVQQAAALIAPIHTIPSSPGSIDVGRTCTLTLPI